jgi:hypothetical protein
MVTERNSPCPCGSGKKYKKCCLATDDAAAVARLAEAAAQKVEEQRLAAAAAEEADRKIEQERQERVKAREALRVPTVAEELGLDDERQARPDRYLVWPRPAEADQRVVDAWWEAVELEYEKPRESKQAAWLLERTVAFLDEHPQLFRELYLHDEFLFQLEAALRRVGRGDDFRTLMLRLRAEQPEVYFQGFGFWDRGLLADALLAGRKEDIPACLALFRQEPVKFIDQFAEVVDLLAWHGCEAELRGLLEPYARKIADSPGVFGGNFGLKWLTTLAMIPALEAGAGSPIPLDLQFKEVMEIEYLEDHEDNREWLRRAVLMASPTEAAATFNLCQPHSTRFDSDLSWDVAGWLHRTKGFGWASARFLTEALINYWYWAEKKRKGGNKGAKREPARFGLKAGRLREYLGECCQDFLGTRTIQALPTIQAFHYFTEYLVARGHLAEGEARKSQTEAAGCYADIRKGVDPCEPAIRIYPTHEALIAGGSLR